MATIFIVLSVIALTGLIAAAVFNPTAPAAGPALTGFKAWWAANRVGMQKGFGWALGGFLTLAIVVGILTWVFDYPLNLLALVFFWLAIAAFAVLVLGFALGWTFMKWLVRLAIALGVIALLITLIPAFGIKLPAYVGSTTLVAAPPAGEKITLEAATAACGTRGLLSFDPVTGAFACATVTVGDPAPADDGVPTPGPTTCTGPTEAWVKTTLDTLSGETSPFSLLKALDKKFSDEWYLCGSDFGPEGVTLKKDSLFWTDFGDQWQMPVGLERVKTQGNWGVYRVTVPEFVIGRDMTGGGRWVPIQADK